MKTCQGYSFEAHLYKGSSRYSLEAKNLTNALQMSTDMFTWNNKYTVPFLEDGSLYAGLDIRWLKGDPKMLYPNKMYRLYGKMTHL